MIPEHHPGGSEVPLALSTEGNLPAPLPYPHIEKKVALPRQHCLAKCLRPEGPACPLLEPLQMAALPRAGPVGGSSRPEYSIRGAPILGDLGSSRS